MIEEIKLLRPLNCIMSGFAIIIATIIAIPSIEIINYWVPILLAAITAIMVTGAGNALNDYADRKIDRIAHPDRPIPSGKIKASFVWKFSFLLMILSLAVSLFINPWCFIIVIIAIILEIGYATKIHEIAVGKNIVVSILVGLLFIFGGVAVNHFWQLWILGILAFFINMAREIVKDVEDKKGDIKYRNTIPIKYGEKKANIMASSFLILGITFSPLPYFFGLLDDIYLPLIGIADAVFLYSAIVSPDSSFVKKMIKLGMMLALFAFLFASLW